MNSMLFSNRNPDLVLRFEGGMEARLPEIRQMFEKILEDSTRRRLRRGIGYFP